MYMCVELGSSAIMGCGTAEEILFLDNFWIMFPLVPFIHIIYADFLRVNRETRLNFSIRFVTIDILKSIIHLFEFESVVGGRRDKLV